jgi:transposase
VGGTWMSREEVRRAGILERVGRGELKQVEAASPLGISYRQTKRLMKSYRTAGAEGLVHGNAGRRSRRAKPEAIREKALELVREHYREHRASDSDRRCQLSICEGNMGSN